MRHRMWEFIQSQQGFDLISDRLKLRPCQAVDFRGRIPMLYYSFSSEKSYLPSRLICA